MTTQYKYLITQCRKNMQKFNQLKTVIIYMIICLLMEYMQMEIKLKKQQNQKMEIVFNLGNVRIVIFLDQCLYKFVDKNSGNRNKSKGKGKINLKDYLFEEIEPIQNKVKSQTDVKNMVKQQSILSQPKSQHGPKKKMKPKQSKIKIPNLTDYLKLASGSQKQAQNPNEQQSFHEEKFIRNRTDHPPQKQSKIVLNSLQHQIPEEEELKQFRLDKREKNLYIQQQQIIKNLQKQKRKVEEEQLKKELEQAKMTEDLFQKQLLLQQKVREEQEKVLKEKQQLEEEFVKREQIKREEELRKIQQLEEKEKEMMAKIQDQRIRQVQQLKVKEETFRKQSENQYRNQYEKRKKQLQLEAEALARQYQNIYKETIRKVRTKIQDQQNTIHKMQQNEQQLLQQQTKLDEQIQQLKKQLDKIKNIFIQINGRNRSCLLYASHIQAKIDALPTKEFREQQEGYYKSSTGFNRTQKTGVAKKLQETVTNSRKLLKIKDKQYENVKQKITTLSISVKQKQFSSSSGIGDFLDTICQNLTTIENLKQEYLQLVENQRTIQQMWEINLQENTQLQNRNKLLENDIAKYMRQIDENSKDQIKKCTEQRLHMLKVMYLCPEKKKNAAKFLIEEMLNIEQQIHKFRIENEESHRKIGKIISETEKLKKENQQFSQILFSQDENGHHFDNMKIVINSLMDKIEEERAVDSVGACLEMTREIERLELVIQNELERKKRLRGNIRKISEIGLAPTQIKMNQKNPLSYFGDLLTTKQIEIEKRKQATASLQNDANNIKIQIKLLEEKKQKMSQALQKYKMEQLNEAKKYLTTNSNK